MNPVDWWACVVCKTVPDGRYGWLTLPSPGRNPRYWCPDHRHEAPTK